MLHHIIGTVICYYLSNRVYELNYDINIAYTQQNSLNDHTNVPQLQDNQAYVESQQLSQNSEEPIYERMSDLSAKYAQMFEVMCSKESSPTCTKEFSSDVGDQASATVKQ